MRAFRVFRYIVLFQLRGARQISGPAQAYVCCFFNQVCRAVAEEFIKDLLDVLLVKKQASCLFRCGRRQKLIVSSQGFGNLIMNRALLAWS